MSDDLKNVVSPGRPRLAITLGDVAGVGPEIVARCWTESLLSICEPVVVGHPVVLARAAALVNPRLQIERRDSV
ncbi:MAG: 4-hydroxythreonine-4-phosphate dehydrogenase PdxA, partial [Planctomycetaceae bacterium]